LSQDILTGLTIVPAEMGWWILSYPLNRLSPDK